MRIKPILAAAMLTVTIAWPGAAQELEPRAYRTLPIGLNAFVLAGVYSNGNVVADATSPIQDLELTSTTMILAYLRSFGLFGRSASITVGVPYLRMSGSGTLSGEFVSGSRSGASNLRLRLAANLLGGPALTPEEFAKYRQRRNLGVSLTVTTPTGQYDSSRLISFGTNRWGFKPEIGYSSIKGRWILELASGVWLFTTNDDFFGGTTRKQDPIGSFQGHLSYNFKGGVGGGSGRQLLHGRTHHDRWNHQC